MKENDAEHKAFEELGQEMGLDLAMHPLHLLYLSEQTDKYLKIFKAGYAAASASAPSVPDYIRGKDLPPHNGILL